MLTPDQLKWIDHLRDDDEIKIIPFDPTTEEKFIKIKSLIQSKLGQNIDVEHHGATSLGISGQDEIDIYVPVSVDEFENYLLKLEKLFGQPRSLYSQERTRFVTNVDGKHVDIFLINNQGDGWLNCLKFEEHLKNNSGALDDYRRLKEEGNGLSTRKYYRRKIEFINAILLKC